MIPQIATGSFTGNGAAKNVPLGFKPLFVVVLNITDGTTVDMYIDDLVNTPTGSVDIDVAAGPVTDAGGITRYLGDSTNAPGFSLDAGNNPNGKVLRYVAIG